MNLDQRRQRALPFYSLVEQFPYSDDPIQAAIDYANRHDLTLDDVFMGRPSDDDKKRDDWY